jgi:hypothetical protein
MKDVTLRSLDAFRGYEVEPRSWDDIARFYREETGGSFLAMLPLVDTLRKSAAARDLWAFTSMHTLAISDSADHRTGDSTLYITCRPTEQTFEFHHHSFSGHEDCMTCSEPEALHALRTFLKYKFSVLLEEP